VHTAEIRRRLWAARKAHHKLKVREQLAQQVKDGRKVSEAAKKLHSLILMIDPLNGAVTVGQQEWVLLWDAYYERKWGQDDSVGFNIVQDYMNSMDGVSIHISGTAVMNILTALKHLERLDCYDISGHALSKTFVREQRGGRDRKAAQQHRQ